MHWIVGGLVEALVSFLMGIIGGIMSFFTKMIGTSFGTDPRAFVEIFPITDEFHLAFIAIGYALCILLFLLGCMRNMFSGFGFAGEKPLNMFVRLVMGLVLIYCLGDILNLFYASAVGSHSSIFGGMYDAIYNIENADGSSFGAFWSDKSLADFASYVATGGYAQIVKAIVCLVLITVIAINYVKLLLEMFERYLLVNLIIFFAPLSASSIVLESTGKIFSSYLKMYFGQIMTLFMNLISVKIIDSSMGVAVAALADSSKVSALDSVGDFKVYVILLVIIAMLKVLQRMDNYMRDIGLTVGVTGGAMWDDIYGASKAVSGMMKGMGKRSGGGSGVGAKAAGAAAGAYYTGATLSGHTASFANGGALGGMLGTMSDVKNAMKMKNDPNSSLRNADFKTRLSAAHTGRVGMGAVGGAAAALSKMGNDKASNVAANKIGQMMTSSGTENQSLVSKDSSKSTPTRMAFKEFQGSLNPVGEYENPIGTSSLRDVQVGYGGALGMNDNGDLIGISTEPPKFEGAGVEEYQDSNGSVYYAQNLTAANVSYKATHNGEEYSGFTNAAAAYRDNSNTNFSGMTGDVKQFKGADVYKPITASPTATEPSGAGPVVSKKDASANVGASVKPVQNSENSAKPSKYK